MQNINYGIVKATKRYQIFLESMEQMWLFGITTNIVGPIALPQFALKVWRISQEIRTCWALLAASKAAKEGPS